MSLIINSGWESAFLLGDVFHGPAQVTETDWVFRFDMDSDQAGRTRREILDRAERETPPSPSATTTGSGKWFKSKARDTGRRFNQIRPDQGVRYAA
jgi:hypothetical protein